MSYGSDNEEGRGYNAQDDELHQQIIENDAEIAQKQQAMNQTRMRVIHAQGAMQWEPGMMAAPVSAPAARSNNITSGYDSLVNQMPGLDKGTKLQTKIMYRNKTGQRITNDVLKGI